MLNLAQETLLNLYYQIFPHRNEALFLEFLPRGYRLTTLSSVGEPFLSSLLEAKWCLGLLITLCDDFADCPEYMNFALLENFRLITLGHKCIADRRNEQERLALNLVEKLVDRIFETLPSLPQFGALRELFLFDLAQFFNGNYYSALLTKNPFFANAAEARVYQAHNMGIITAGMMDLAASERFIPSELGTIREIFSKAQVVARLANVLTTTDREIRQGDMTSELLIRMRESQESLEELKTTLQGEIREILAEISALNKVETFSVEKYAASIAGFFSLHKEFEGRI